MSAPISRPDLLALLGVTVSRLVTDSREVKAGDTFVAFPGSRVDGRQFIAQAVAGGAKAVIWEARDFIWNPAWQIPNLAVAGLRHHLGEIADQVYGGPSKKLWMVGVTGTNGKTSCGHWIAQAFNALNKKSALLGTLGNGFPGDLQPALNTTPDAIRLHGLLADYLAQGARAAVMEVSSHALDQGRVNGVHYDVALLTNLSRDHLDYHGSMSSYAATKRRLFGWRQLGYAVLNLDDAFGLEMAEQLRDSGPEVIAYGLTPAALATAERLGLRMVHGTGLHMGEQRGFDLQVRSSWGGGTLHSGLVGRFNAANLLGVLAVLLASGITLADALHELGQAQAVRGRMQALGGSDRPSVVVDYAHTPDALEKVLLSLREVAQARGGKLICVFGCGGDRDRGKRPLMGVIADRLADTCIVTSDNPRSEPPAEIIAAIAAGMSGAQQSIENRALAISLAISGARTADTVLVAGKGHEDYQEINGVKYPFSDIETVRCALQHWPQQQAQSAHEAGNTRGAGA